MTLIFDTETTGLIQFKKPYTDPSQPRLVQLAALLFDKDWIVRAELNLLIKLNEQTIIDPKAFEAHGISKAMTQQYGFNPVDALLMFNSMLAMATTVVGHNIAFDKLMLEAESHRVFNGIKQPSWPGKIFCTMQEMTQVCKLPTNWGKGKYKWPTLQEAHTKCFGKGFEDAHDAMNDVRACARIYRWMILPLNQSK